MNLMNDFLMCLLKYVGYVKLQTDSFIFLMDFLELYFNLLAFILYFTIRLVVSYLIWTEIYFQNYNSDRLSKFPVIFTIHYSCL